MQGPSLSRRTALTAAGALLLPGAAPPGSPMPVGTAASFIDSVGTCVHLTLEPYKSRAEQFRTLLAGSRIRHIREEIRPGNDPARWRELHAGLGVQFQLLVSPGTNTAQQMLALIDTLGPGVVTAVEGQNEANNPWFQKLPVTRGDWAGTTIAYQRDIFQALRQRYTAAQMPVVSPTMLDYRPQDVPLIAAAAPFCDIVALHPYVQHAQEPETGEFAAALSWYIRNFRDPFKPGAPTMVTEIGYSNVTSPGGRGISERAASFYVPRLLLNNYQSGMIRSFLYEFMDDGTDPANYEHHYGLVRNDGTPKPAYHTLAALMAALDDRGITGNRVTPLRVAVPEAPADLLQQAFTRRDGTTVVALWRPARMWDVGSGRDIEPSPMPVTVTLDKPNLNWRSLPLDGAAAWTAPQPAGASFRVAVSGRVTLIRLEPQV